MELRKQFEIESELSAVGGVDVFRCKYITWLEEKLKSHNNDYAKCLEDLYENYPYKEEWDKADIAEFIEKHFV